MRAVAFSALAVGVATLIFAAALSFENGLIADASGGVGQTTLVHAAMYWLALGAFVVSAVSGVAALRLQKNVVASSAGTVR